jgi:septum formation protein
VFNGIEPAKLILASNSPRRKQLLALGNWNFQVIVSDIDESRHANEKADAYVVRLAREKTLAVAHKTTAQSVIIGSDTSVIDGEEILGKPQNAEDAVRMLRQLRGRTHQVYTGIAIHRPSDGLMLTDLSITDVPMRAYSDDEISAYVQTGDPLDKAGAYAIQHPDFHPVESMSGCYAGVMGLPMCHVLRLLNKVGLPPEADVPLACQFLLKYQCPVSSAILRGETV